MSNTDPEAVAALVERIKEHGIYQSDPIFIDAIDLIEALVSERDTLVVESYDMTAFYTAAVDELHWANVSMERAHKLTARGVRVEQGEGLNKERLAWLLSDVADRLPHTDVGRERYVECMGAAAALREGGPC